MLANNIKVEEIVAGIFNALSANQALVSKLAKSTPINDPNGSPMRKNSIIPMSKGQDESGTRPVPFIGIRSGNMVRRGLNSYDVFVFIRCYTGLDKSFVTTNEIVSLINNSLDRQFINFQTAVTAEMSLEQLTGEEYDEGWKLNYREGQFKLIIT